MEDLCSSTMVPFVMLVPANGALFHFFEQLSNRQFSEAYDALLSMSDAQLDERR